MDLCREVKHPGIVGGVQKILPSQVPGGGLAGQPAAISTTSRGGSNKDQDLKPKKAYSKLSTNKARLPQKVSLNAVSQQAACGQPS
jgi:hypothetical protein